MKHISILFISLSIVISVYSQGSLKILKTTDSTDISGTEYIVPGKHSTFEIKKAFLVEWTGSDSSYVSITRRELQIINGTADYYCWYICYAPKDAGTVPVWVAPDNLWLYIDSINSSFSVYLNPRGKSGIAKYRYTFYPTENPTDTSFIDVTFDVVVGLEEYEMNSVKIYPNPSSDFINIDIDLKNENILKYRLINIEGKDILSGNLSSGISTLNISNLNRGLYFIELLDENNHLFKSEKLLLK